MSDSFIVLKTRGLRGVNNNCFLNCLMISMFGYKYSPFFQYKTPRW